MAFYFVVPELCVIQTGELTPQNLQIANCPPRLEKINRKNERIKTAIHGLFRINVLIVMRGTIVPRFRY